MNESVSMLCSLRRSIRFYAWVLVSSNDRLNVMTMCRWNMDSVCVCLCRSC